jgi:hypothetical protein
MSCSSSCATKDHKSYGECLRAKSLQVSPQVNEVYRSKQKKWDSDLNHYESAVRQGLQPEGTQRHQVDAAFREAENG